MAELEKVGVIYGDVSTLEFKCNVIGHLEMGEYVQMYHPKNGWILGRVDSIERLTNLSLEKANELVNGKDVEIKERLSATITIIGYRDSGGILQYPRTPLRAGDFVYRAQDSLISEVIGIEDIKERGAYVGKLYGHDIPIYLDINKMVQKHVSILAKTGAGKSYLTGVILEELIKHGVTVVVIDPHGEYSSMRKPARKTKAHSEFGVNPRGYSDKIIVFAPQCAGVKNAKPLRFTLSNLSPLELLSLTNISSPKSYVQPLRKAMDSLKISRGDYTMKELITTLIRDVESDAVATLKTELKYLDNIGIFDRQGTKISDIVRKGMMSIINLRGVPPDIQEFVVHKLAYALFELRKRERIPPLMLVIEEAHNFAPQQGKALSSKILRTIASEGRKFGLGLMIISQRPAKVDKNVLSQCNTQIILKVTNPNDLKVIGNSVEGLTKGMLEEIKRLPVGVAVISGILTMPLMVRIRPRESMHGGESVKVV